MLHQHAGDHAWRVHRWAKKVSQTHDIDGCCHGRRPLVQQQPAVNGEATFLGRLQLFLGLVLLTHRCIILPAMSTCICLVGTVMLLKWYSERNASATRSTTKKNE